MDAGPVKKSVQKHIAELDFMIDTFELNAMIQKCGTSPQ